MICVEGLEKRINGDFIINNLNLELERGKVLGLIGSSGCGKTTTLMMISGLMPFNKGKITINDCSIDSSVFNYKSNKIWEFRKKSGIVFQHLYLFPHLTVLGNIIEAPIHVLKLDKKQVTQRAEEYLKQLGMENHLDKYPEKLSGGEQQRVAIIRALIMDPEIILLDEPTSALDPKRSNDIRELLKTFVSKGHTLIVVSHSIGFLKGFADFLAYMEKGSIVEFGTYEDVTDNPKDKRTFDFLEDYK